MTEAEWNACTDPTAMLDFLRSTGKLSERKARLFAVACCKRIRHLPSIDAIRDSIEASENYADGLISQEALRTAHDAAGVAASQDYNSHSAADATVSAAAPPYRHPEYVGDASWYAANAVADAALGTPLHNCFWPAWDDTAEPQRLAWDNARRAELVRQTGLLRDIFGPLPFRSVTIASSCLTTAVLALAHAAYNDRQMPSGILKTDRLAVLAQALADAGCTDAELLEHMRGAGPHVRACWALDMMLTKE